MPITAHAKASNRSVAWRRGSFIGLALATLLEVSVAAILIIHNATAKLSPSVGSVAANVSNVSAIGQHWSVNVSGTYRDQDFLIVLGFDRSQALPYEIQLRDRGTGALDGSVRVVYDPLVLRRQSQHELLVSYGGADSSLLVFDTANRLALKEQINLPNRINYNVYAPYGMALSGDQQHLFYLAQQSHAELPECNQPHSNAAVCDLVSVAIVDLARGMVTSQTALPQDCGYASLNPVGATDVIATCTNTDPIQEINAQGQIVKHDNMSGRGLFGFLTAQGGFAAVLRDGTVVTHNHDGTYSRTAALPAGAQVDPTSQVAMYAEGQLFIPYSSNQKNTKGFVLFDLASGEVQRDATISSSLYITARPGEVLTLLTSGLLQQLDLSSPVSGPSNAPVTVAWSVATSSTNWGLVP